MAAETELPDDCTTELEQESVVIQEDDDILFYGKIKSQTTIQEIVFRLVFRIFISLSSSSPLCVDCYGLDFWQLKKPSEK